MVIADERLMQRTRLYRRREFVSPQFWSIATDGVGPGGETCQRWDWSMKVEPAVGIEWVCDLSLLCPSHTSQMKGAKRSVLTARLGRLFWAIDFALSTCTGRLVLLC